jgi:TRAP-type C4-dicarboxylate transport system permease small subunit
MQKLLKFHQLLANFLGLLILLIVLIIVTEASSRYLFNEPLPGPIEGSRVILAWILFLSLAYALVQGAHIQVQLFLDRYPPRIRLVAYTLIDIVSLCFFGLIMYSGWLQFWESFRASETMAAPIWIPFWLAKLAVPIGCLIFIAQFGINAVNRIVNVVNAQKKKESGLTGKGVD